MDKPATTTRSARAASRRYASSAADVQSSVGSDTPPDATASSLGCANRGSATNPRTNRDCTLYTNLGAQVTVNFVAGNSPPVANPDNYNRPKGTSLKIKISDLLTNVDRAARASGAIGRQPALAVGAEDDGVE